MDPLVALGRALKARNYRFVTPTPETHRRVLRNQPGPARTLRDVYGWSKPYGELEPELRPLTEGNPSSTRFSSYGDLLFAHSAYPTTQPDAVFFGPDTYRFCALVEQRIHDAKNVADVGCGSGAGGILLAEKADVQLLDINEKALRYARANCAINDRRARVAHSDILAGAEGPLDLVIANPPYLADDAHRAYRDGGGALGTGLSVRIVQEALQRLAPRGRLLLYTATPVIDGKHVLWPALEPLLANTRWDYRELDPDVFREELDRAVYVQAERICVVALDAVKL